MPRRTRSQKENPKHPFLVHWEGGTDTPVKGQNKKLKKSKAKKTSTSKNAVFLEKGRDIASIRHEIIRSLIVTSFILGLELVLYLAWK